MRHFYTLAGEMGKNYLMSSQFLQVLPLHNPMREALMKNIWMAFGVVAVLTTATAAVPTAAPAVGAPAAAQRQWREVTIPAGTILKVNLNTSVGSDTSRIEDPVRGTLRSPVIIRGVTALPSGTAISGYVTDAARSGRV